MNWICMKEKKNMKENRRPVEPVCHSSVYEDWPGSE